MREKIMLEEKITNDYKQAMKDKDTAKSSILSFLRAQILNAAIAKKKKRLDDEEVVAVIRKQLKQHQDAIEQFKDAGRQELADKEKRELEILKGYLPAELPLEELKRIIEEAAASVGASGIKDMGRVMKEAGAKIAGRADSKTVSELVRTRLSKPAA